MLRLFDENENDLMNGLVLLQKSSLYGHLDCFDMALQGNEVKFKFFSMPSVQTLLTNLWNGEVKIKSGYMNALKVCQYRKFRFVNKYLLFSNNLLLQFVSSILSFGVVAPFFIFSNLQSIVDLVINSGFERTLYIRVCLLYDFVF